MRPYRRRIPRSPWAVVLLLHACTSDPTGTRPDEADAGVDAGKPAIEDGGAVNGDDAGEPRDAGEPDAGDAGGQRDAGEPDAGDAGEPDAGDAGELDAGDAGEPDAGDAGELDAGDAGE